MPVYFHCLAACAFLRFDAFITLLRYFTFTLSLPRYATPPHTPPFSPLPPAAEHAGVYAMLSPRLMPMLSAPDIVTRHMRSKKTSYAMLCMI